VEAGSAAVFIAALPALVACALSELEYPPQAFNRSAQETENITVKKSLY
jgi:hypothetical protein